MTGQDEYIRDVVVPIFKGRWSDEAFHYEELAGSAFLIGGDGWAVTAAHVLDQLGDSRTMAAIGLVRNTKWFPCRIHETQKHSVEDVAIIRCHAAVPRSWLEISEAVEHQSCNYRSWGYPRAVAESAARYGDDRHESPDLIYTQGYVRRRLSGVPPVSVFTGESFYEVSEQGGQGYSGAPLILRNSMGHPHWRVFAVYIGESSGATQVAYAARSDAFASWAPSLLGHTLREESLK